jgi:hypothetical protein
MVIYHKPADPSKIGPPKKKVVQKVGGVDQAKVGGSEPPRPPYVVAPLPNCVIACDNIEDYIHIELCLIF